jgi:outer membrane usher protein
MHAVLKGLLHVALVAALVAPLGLPAAGAAVGDSADDQRAPLTLVLNGVEKGIVMAVLRSDDALVTEQELVAAGVPLPGARYVSLSGTRYVSIVSLAPKVTYIIDLANVSLKLQADPALLPRTTTRLNDTVAPRPLATAVPSGFVNYTVSDDALNPTAGASGFVQAGIGDAGGLLLASGSYANGVGRRGLIAFQRESQSNMSRTTFGDEVAATSMLGGSALLAGFGVSRHFEFQPAYAYFPTPGISGTALTPVTADIYVNGSFLRSVQLPPGQFDLTNLPLPTGANLTQVVLHDPSGATTTLSGLSYQSQQLLAKGVTDYNYHVGFLRANPFGDNDTYGPLAALGSYRLGLTDHVTVGARFETTQQMLSGGPQIEIGLPMGQVSFESGWSHSGGAGGNAFGAAYDVQIGRFTLNASASEMSAQYATTSLASNAPRTRSSIEQSLSVPLTKVTSFALSHTTSTFTGAAAADQLSASISTRLRRGVSLNFNAERDRGSSVFGPAAGAPTRSWTIGTSASFNLSPATSLIAQTQAGTGSSSSSLTVSKSAPNGPGFGFVVRGNASGDSGPAQPSVSANLSYQTQYADLSGLLDSAEGSASATFTLSGSLVGFKQGLFFARPVTNAYTLAQVPGFRDFPIFLGDSYQGRTDGRGDLVVPVLQGYTENYVRIGDMTGAIDVMEDQASLDVRPKADQGVVAAFGVRVVRAYAGTVVVRRLGADVIPAFARVVLTAGDRHFTTDLGSEGQFYLENVPPGSYAATLTGGASLGCAFTLTLPAANQAVTELGAFACEATR